MANEIVLLWGLFLCRYKAVTFVPIGQMGRAYAAQCAQPIEELMSSSDQGVELNLVDDDSQLVELSNGIDLF